MKTDEGVNMQVQLHHSGRAGPTAVLDAEEKRKTFFHLLGIELWPSGSQPVTLVTEVS
jgi:hypothetical protein